MNSTEAAQIAVSTLNPYLKTRADARLAYKQIVGVGSFIPTGRADKITDHGRMVRRILAIAMNLHITHRLTWKPLARGEAEHLSSRVVLAGDKDGTAHVGEKARKKRLTTGDPCGETRIQALVQ